MELFRALGAFVEPPSPELAGLAELLDLGRPPTNEEHTELFVFQLIPCASIYLGPEGMLGGEARDRIAGFWRVIGSTPPAEPDHLAIMFALAAQLADVEVAERDEVRGEVLARARSVFFWEHLASWLPFYLSKVVETALPPYVGWARLALDALREEGARSGTPDRRSIHLREAPAPADPRIAGAETFLRTLLAPVCSGIILTRTDLASAARELGLGVRLADRRLALETLVDQDPHRTLIWLADYAARSSDRHAQHTEAFGDAAAFWTERAAQTEKMLRALATDLGHRGTEAQRS